MVLPVSFSLKFASCFTYFQRFFPFMFLDVNKLSIPTSKNFALKKNRALNSDLAIS